VVTPFDENFVDNKMLEIDKVFDCSFFIYENPLEVDSNLGTFKSGLTFYLAKYINECSKHKLQVNMDSSIGEATDISRYWYSTGIGDLFQKDIISSFDNDKDSTQFYVKFIEELLCKINKINNLEVYPFDRVFIFPSTGIDDVQNPDIGSKEIEEITVLEAHVKSMDPLDKGGYISSWEGVATQDMVEGYQSISGMGSRLTEDVDLNFSDKRVTKFKWNINKIGDSIKTRKIGNIEDNSGYIGSNLLLGTLLLSRKIQLELLSGEKSAETNKLSRYLRKNRVNFDEMGLYYEYSHGLTLEEEFPYLYELQNLYFDVIADKIMMKSNNKDFRGNLSIPVSELKTKDIRVKYRDKIPQKILIEKLKNDIKFNYKSKVIVVSFDPNSIQNKEEASFVDVTRNAFTMIFVADFDFPKSVAELNAEIKDFKVLIQMVIRQIINHKANEQKIAHEQLRVRGVLESSIHSIKSFLSNMEDKKQVDLVLQAAMSNLVSKTKSKVKEFTGNNTYNDFFKSLLRKGVKTLDEQVEAYNIKDHLFETKFNSIFFPSFSLDWDDAFVPEAFNVILKNAVEYASEYGSYSKIKGQVIVSMQLETLNNTEEYLVISIINNTRNLSRSKFKEMNDESLTNIGIDANKYGSTGIGVVQARRQLQGVNTNNNIIYTMINENIISVKMSLKIEVLANERFFHDETKDKEAFISPDVAFNGTLYFEDSKVNYEQSIAFMEKSDIDYKHFVKCNNNFMKNAIILILDMNILNKYDVPSEREGLNAIHDFKTLNTKNSPICIFSNGLGSSIKPKIVEHLKIDSGLVVIISEGDYDFKLKDGLIYIIDGVKILGKEHFMILKHIILNTIKEIKPKKENINSSFSYSSKQMLNDNGTYNNDFSDTFNNLEKVVEDEYFYIALHSVKKVDLATALERWKAFETEIANDPKEKRLVYNTTYHQNTLLIIDDIELANEKQKLWVFYLGVTNNIYFNFNELSTEDIMLQWHDIAIKRESLGYLSKLRHDIKNIKLQYASTNIDPNLDEFFQNVIDMSITLQSQLKAGPYESLDTYIKYIKTPSVNNNFNYTSASNIEKNIKIIIGNLDGILKIITKHNQKKQVKSILLFKKILDLNYQICQSREIT